MKIRVVLFGFLAALLLAGCAHQPLARGGASGDQFEGDTQAQVSGHGTSGMEPYQQTLSDPGPF